MKGPGEVIDRGGWRLEVELPEALRARRDDLIDRVEATVERGLEVPLRRSRRAVTYNPRVLVANDLPGDIFIKVLEAPHGVSRIKYRRRGSLVTRVKAITAQLCAAGFVAPPIWLCGYNRRDGRELLVTPRVTGTGPLQTLAAVGGHLVQKREVLRALGRAIGRLHRAGFVHGDLTPFNLFVQLGAPVRFIFLDHEKTRRNFGLGRKRRNLRNLVQLGRFDLPGISRSDRLRVLHAYTDAIGARDQRPIVRRVAQMLAARLVRDGGAQMIAPLQPAKL